MEVQCKDRQRIFEDGTPAEWSALEAHAAQCAGCAEELQAWRALSDAAQTLRMAEDQPPLWPRIEQSLAAQAAAGADSGGRRWIEVWKRTFTLTPAWQSTAAAVLILALAVGGGWMYKSRSVRPTPVADSHLLQNSALNEVQQAQDAYVKAIARLAASAQPQLENPATPLMASYREKLLVLDGAIAELEAQAQQNPSNAHLRGELLAMYREKQNTLESVLEEKQP
jgi:hypothetical protein